MGGRLGALVGLVVGTVVVSVSATVASEDAAVPPTLQAQLLAKVAAYDKNFPSRAGERAQIWIVTRPGDDTSARVGKAMQKELAGQPTVGGLPHDETLVGYPGAAPLADKVKKGKVAIVYFAPGFGDQVDAIRDALTGADVLSVTAVPEHVPRGMVLGFDLVSGKSKLLCHLGQAKKQHVAFKAEVLKLMKVYE